MKKKVDPRIRQMLQDAVTNNHRALLVLVGDKSRDQVVNLHYMLSKQTLTSRPTVLWCYKKELGFSSSKRKRMKVIKKRMKQGLVDASRDDPFELFISATTIRFAYYSESHKVLGNTYGMCVLQDFEALTPNLLARTTETVQGGGLIVLLINDMKSLKQLFSLTMDVHARLRTEAFHKVVPRFNERFILSLADCPAAIVADDELNVLPISSHIRALSGSSSTVPHSLPSASEIGGKTKNNEDIPELANLKKALEEAQPVGSLIAKTKTLDQAKALLRFEEALSDKTLRTTVALTASRGRGKSAALGLAVAAAIAHDYSNIFVTSPSPENLRTFFAFLLFGFDGLGMQEHTDYEAVHNKEENVIIRVNIFKSHRQTVQYVAPGDAVQKGVLAQAELVVIDEAAAIPLPIVEALLGPYVVFMASTVTGYEGTGRSLSLKLLKKLRDAGSVDKNNSKGRVFHEVHMEVPIRYSAEDPVETWLYDLLCLSAGGARQALTRGAPHPSECELFYVERDALFSRHRASEQFLQRVVALFVSSHYKNSPNDLQMLSDAPAHGLFVLLAPTGSDATELPDVLVAVQVCLEGRLSGRTAREGLGRAARAAGDLIPWTIGQQFQEPGFAELAGVRIVRVATHPDLQGMGYGTRAMRSLMDYYSGKIISLSVNDEAIETKNSEDNDDDEEEGAGEDEKDGLLNEVIGPRKNIPPLLKRLYERKPELLDYIGVSFGLTDSLYNFWSGKLGFLPLYIRLTANELTGEHTCIMASCCVDGKSELQEEEGLVRKFSASWLTEFHEDFRRRLVYLLGFELSKLSPKVATAMLSTSSNSKEKGKGKDDVKRALYGYDMRRLESYARNLVDFHLVMDLIPKLAELFVLGAFDDGDDESMGDGEAVSMSAAQRAILVAVGLQRKKVEQVASELDVQVGQVLALLNKVVRKFSKALRERAEAEAVREIGAPSTAGDDNKENAGKDEDSDGEEDEEEVQNEVSGELEKFKIEGSEKEWEKAIAGSKRDGGDRSVPGVVSVKAVKRKASGENENNGEVEKESRKKAKETDAKGERGDGDSSKKKKKKRKVLS